MTISKNERTTRSYEDIRKLVIRLFGIEVFSVTIGETE